VSGSNCPLLKNAPTGSERVTTVLGPLERCEGNRDRAGVLYGFADRGQAAGIGVDSPLHDGVALFVCRVEELLRRPEAYEAGNASEDKRGLFADKRGLLTVVPRTHANAGGLASAAKSRYAFFRIDFTTFPWTSVNRNALPWNL
jgi:hypothetical protein